MIASGFLITLTWTASLVACASSQHSRAAGKPTLLVHGATVLDGTDARPRHNLSVLIEGSRITQAGPAGSFAVPKDARIIDASGRWLTPGLWDMHVHLGKAGEAALPMFLGAGVTSVRDMGGDLTQLLDLRRRIAAGELTGPNLIVSGPMLDAPVALERLKRSRTDEPYWRTRVVVATPADAPRLVDSIATLGADFIKVRETSSLDTYRAIVAAARARSIALAGHAPYSMPAMDGARLGLATIEHASYPYPLDTNPRVREPLLRAFREAETAIVPTLVAWYSYLMDPDSVAILVGDSTGAREPRGPALKGLVREWGYDFAVKKRLSDTSMRGWCGFINRTLQDLAAMHKAGIPILAGTDLAITGAFPGWSLHDELRLLVRGSVLTPAEALRSATSLAAKYAGRIDEVGTVEVGKRADILLLDADPTVDVEALKRISAVILNGAVLDSAALLRFRGGVPLSYEGDINLLPRLDVAGCER